MDHWQEYEEIIGGNNDKIPVFAARVEEKYSVHSRKCHLIRFIYGFLYFLHLLKEDSEPQPLEVPSSVTPLKDEGLNEEISLDPIQERDLLPTDMLSLVFYEASSSSMTQWVVVDQEGDIPLSCFLRFLIVYQNDYVLLTDIMHCFNICEDFYFAILSNYSEADMDFVEEGLDEHLLVDFDV